jgi:hypothetical protein
VSLVIHSVSVYSCQAVAECQTAMMAASVESADDAMT